MCDSAVSFDDGSPVIGVYGMYPNHFSLDPYYTGEGSYTVPLLELISMFRTVCKVCCDRCYENIGEMTDCLNSEVVCGLSNGESAFVLKLCRDFLQDVTSLSLCMRTMLELRYGSDVNGCVSAVADVYGHVCSMELRMEKFSPVFNSLGLKNLNVVFLTRCLSCKSKLEDVLVLLGFGVSGVVSK